MPSATNKTFMLNVVILIVIMLCVVILNVVAPWLPRSLRVSYEKLSAKTGGLM